MGRPPAGFRPHCFLSELRIAAFHCLHQEFFFQKSPSTDGKMLFKIVLYHIINKYAVVRAKAKMKNILSRKSLEKTKQIQPCC